MSKMVIYKLTLSLLGGLNNTTVCLKDNNNYDIESLRD